MAFYCNGKKGICDCDFLCQDCTYFDNSGGKHIPTNADRIRAMSDEELAHELARVASWDRKEYGKAKRIGLERVILDILQQPAEGE